MKTIIVLLAVITFTIPALCSAEARTGNCSYVSAGEIIPCTSITTRTSGAAIDLYPILPTLEKHGIAFTNTHARELVTTGKVMVRGVKDEPRFFLQHTTHTTALVTSDGKQVTLSQLTAESSLNFMALGVQVAILLLAFSSGLHVRERGVTGVIMSFVIILYGLWLTFMSVVNFGFTDSRYTHEVILFLILIFGCWLMGWRSFETFRRRKWW